jgi:hypothetical protein
MYFDFYLVTFWAVEIANAIQINKCPAAVSICHWVYYILCTRNCLMRMWIICHKFLNTMEYLHLFELHLIQYEMCIILVQVVFRWSSSSPNVKLCSSSRMLNKDAIVICGIIFNIQTFKAIDGILYMLCTTLPITVCRYQAFYNQVFWS